MDLRAAHRRPDAPGTRRARRARRPAVRGRPAPVPRRGVRARRPVGAATSSPRSASPTPVWRRPPTAAMAVVGSRPGADPEAPHRAALRPLRRAAAAGRRRLAHAAVRADRGGRALVRPRCRRLQGQHRHAPRGAARPRRRHPGQPEARRRGIRGAGHRRARGVRPRPTPTCCAPTRSWSATPATPPSGHPAATVSLRGMVNVVVTVEALASELHSGMFGGAAPDALAALVAMLATLRDERRQHHDHRARQHPDAGPARRTRPSSSAPTPACSTESRCWATAASPTCSGRDRPSPSSASTARRSSARPRRSSRRQPRG